MTIKHRLPVALFILFISSSALYAGYHEEGKKYYMRKQYDQAREMFLKSIQATDYGDSYYFLGEIEKNAGNYEPAEKYFRAALLKKTTDKYKKNAFWNIIILTQQRGDYEEMTRICLELWRKNNDQGARDKVESLINRFLWSDNKEAVEFYNQGLGKKKNDRNDEAADLYRQALGADTKFLAPRFELAMMAYHKGDFNSAAENLRPVVEGIPFYGEANIVMGDIEFNRRYFDKAAECFTRGLEFGFNSNDSEFIIRYKRGNCYYQLDQLDKAKEDLARASELDKKSAKPLMLLSAILIREKNYDEAITTLNKADKIDKDNPLILFQIGSIYYKKNDSRYAGYFDRLFDLVRDDTSDNASSYRKAFGILLREHYSKGNYSRAVQIIDTMPDRETSFDLRLTKARSLYHTGNYQGAADIFERLSLEDEDRFMLCRSLASTGRSEKARAILEKLITREKYKQSAREDSVLSPVLKEIEDAEKKKLEDERKRLEEERKREEEKRRLEEERRLAEERKAREDELRREEERKAKLLQEKLDAEKKKTEEEKTAEEHGKIPSGAEPEKTPVPQPDGAGR